MSSPVPVMTDGKNGSPGVARRTPDGPAWRRFFCRRRQPFLTVPLLRSVLGSGFQPEGLHQIEGRLTQ